eukprot:127031-Lingulodinium_polyedra.AAC.1
MCIDANGTAVGWPKQTRVAATGGPWYSPQQPQQARQPQSQLAAAREQLGRASRSTLRPCSRRSS